MCKTPFAEGLVTDKKLFYAVAMKLMRHKRHQARSMGGRMLVGMPLEDSFDQYLQIQEQREKAHKTHFEYSIDEYEVSLERIERELDDFYRDYHWPRGSDEPPADTIGSADGNAGST